MSLFEQTRLWLFRSSCLWVKLSARPAQRRICINYAIEVLGDYLDGWPRLLSLVMQHLQLCQGCLLPRRPPLAELPILRCKKPDMINPILSALFQAVHALVCLSRQACC